MCVCVCVYLGDKLMQFWVAVSVSECWCLSSVPILKGVWFKYTE